MNKEDKAKVFSLMIKNFETEEFKKYFLEMCTYIPDYIFTIPSSTSLKYHNATQCQRFGQVYHVYMFSEILNYRLNLKSNKEKFVDPKFRDAMRCVPVFHDTLKCGQNGSYTVHNHPLLAGEWVRKTIVKNNIPDEYKECIARMCERHSGEWTTSTRMKNVILPEPETDAEIFIHECDILSSRSNIDMDIPEELKTILKKIDEDQGFNMDVDIDIEDYIIPIGKYKGQKLVYVNNSHPNYIAWCKENITNEPFKTMLSKL